MCISAAAAIRKTNTSIPVYVSSRALRLRMSFWYLPSLPI